MCWNALKTQWRQKIHDSALQHWTNVEWLRPGPGPMGPVQIHPVSNVAMPLSPTRESGICCLPILDLTELLIRPSQAHRCKIPDCQGQKLLNPQISMEARGIFWTLSWNFASLYFPFLLYIFDHLFGIDNLNDSSELLWDCEWKKVPEPFVSSFSFIMPFQHLPKQTKHMSSLIINL